jgi:hypothetical protein
MIHYFSHHYYHDKWYPFFCWSHKCLSMSWELNGWPFDWCLDFYYLCRMIFVSIFYCNKRKLHIFKLFLSESNKFSLHIQILHHIARNLVESYHGLILPLQMTHIHTFRGRFSDFNEYTKGIIAHKICPEIVLWFY